MFELFVVFSYKLFIVLFFTSIVFKDNILATNESQNSVESNQVLNWTQIEDNSDINDINDNKINSIESTNHTIDGQTDEVLITPDVDQTIDLSNGSNSDNSNNTLAESVVQLNESKVNCTPVRTLSADNQTIDTNSSLILVNASKLTEYLETKPNVSQTTGAQCLVVIFYYKWCPFAAKSAKHFNALARVYPQFYVLAIDAYGLNSVNMRYGLVGVPTALFFHNGKVVGKVNDSEPTVDSFVTYINQLTGLSPVMPINITDADLLGPLSSIPEPRFDYLLLFSWIFCFICFSYLFGKSNVFKTTIETVRNNWREAEAQHEHID